MIIEEYFKDYFYNYCRLAFSRNIIRFSADFASSVGAFDYSVIVIATDRCYNEKEPLSTIQAHYYFIISYILSYGLQLQY